MTGNDDVAGSCEKAVPKGYLGGGKEGDPPLTLPVREGVITVRIYFFVYH